MALPARLARYQTLLDMLVDAALREMEGEAAPHPEPDDTSPSRSPDAQSREPESPAERPTGTQRTAAQ